jgi:hypothetical protein
MNTFTCWAGNSMLGRPQGFSVDMGAVWLAILVEPWWNRDGGTRKIELPEFYREKTGGTTAVS